jgi:hypothetical protein
MTYHYSNKKNAPPQNAKKLTARQEAALEKHKEHHTAKHMALMRKLMRGGMTFTESHKKAMKEVGK